MAGHFQEQMFAEGVHFGAQIVILVLIWQGERLPQQEVSGCSFFSNWWRREAGLLTEPEYP